MSVRCLDSSQRKRVQELVARHKVFFHVAPAREPVPEGIVAVGFDVELSGTHGAGEGPVLPGCSRCLAVWEDLEEVASAIVPEGGRASRYERKRFDHALPSTGLEAREDVRLILSIRHRGDFAAPIDACEQRCLEEIKADLRALGACEGDWSDAKARAARRRPESPAGAR